MVLVNTHFSVGVERYNLRQRKPIAFTSVPWFFESESDEENADDDLVDDSDTVSSYEPSTDGEALDDLAPLTVPSKRPRSRPDGDGNERSLPLAHSEYANGGPGRSGRPALQGTRPALKTGTRETPLVNKGPPQSTSPAAPVTSPVADNAAELKKKAKNRERLRRRRQRDKSKRTASINLEKLEDALLVAANIDVTAHGSGKITFVSPRKYRRKDADENPSAQASRVDLRPEDLHPDLHPDARRLVQDEHMRYIRPGNDAIQFTDRNDVIFAALAARPTDPDLANLHLELYEHFVEVQRRLGKDNSASNPRGAFTRVQFGTSFGGGQKRPTPIRNSKKTDKILREFFKIPAVRRWVRFMTKSGEALFPKTMKLYSEINDNLGLNDRFGCELDDADDFNWYFAATTLNLGPQVVTKEHRDALNFPPGVCTISALGPFNAQTGGHFVMREPGIVLEFRPGDVLFVMSSVITHFNIPLVGALEKRASWTFYTAGGLFRWDVAGRRTLKSMTPWKRAAYEKKAADFLDLAWAAFMTPRELVKYWKNRSAR